MTNSSRQHLDRDVALEAGCRVPCIHLAHPAGAQQCDGFIGSDRVAGASEVATPEASCDESVVSSRGKVSKNEPASTDAVSSR